MPLLRYLAKHAGEPGDFETIRKFTPLAHQADPGLKDRMGGYQQAAGNLIQKLDTLDQGRRAVVLKDAHDSILKPVRLAVKTGKPEHVKAALGALRTHGQRLAKQLGATIPKVHLDALSKLGSPSPAAPAVPAPTSMNAGGATNGY